MINNVVIIPVQLLLLHHSLKAVTLQPAMVLYTTYMISTTTAIYYCNAHGCTNAYFKFIAHLSLLWKFTLTAYGIPTLPFTMVTQFQICLCLCFIRVNIILQGDLDLELVTFGHRKCFVSYKGIRVQAPYTNNLWTCCWLFLFMSRFYVFLQTSNHSFFCDFFLFNFFGTKLHFLALYFFTKHRNIAH